MSTTCISRDAKSTTFDVRSDLIFPASEVVGNLTDFLETIGKEVDRLRDVLNEADATHPSRARSTDSTTLEKLLQHAQDGFTDLQSMAVAIASLVHHSEHGESDSDLAHATNLLYQLQDKADLLAKATDSAHVMRIAEGGAE